MANISEKISSSGAFTEFSTAVDLDLTGQSGNLRVYADTTSATLTVTLPAGESKQIVEVIDAGENAGANIITIAGTIDGAPNTTIESDGATREFTYSGTAWESSGGFERFFTREAATGRIKARAPDTLQLDQINGGDSGSDYIGIPTNFTAAEANVDQDVSGWRNGLSPIAWTRYPTDAPLGKDGALVGQDAMGGKGPWVYQFDMGSVEVIDGIILYIYSVWSGFENCAIAVRTADDSGFTTNVVTRSSAVYDVTGLSQLALPAGFSARYIEINKSSFGGLWLSELVIGKTATTANTFQHRPLTSGGNVTFTPSSLVLRDSTNTPLINGEVLVEYSTDNGATWPGGQRSLNDFKALGNISATSFWLRYEMVGSANMASSIIQSAGSYARMVYDRLVISVLGSDVAKFGSAGARIGVAIVDSNDNEIIIPAETASAVNEITVTNAATGGAPKISATGDDANISLELAPKGTGGVGIGTSTPAGKLQVNVASSKGNVAAWGDGQLVASVGGTSTSSGVALSYDTAQNEGTISSLTPGTAWRRLNLRAEDFVFLASGGTEVARFTSGGLVLNGNATGGNITGVTLDDYEEGTWTPSLGGTATYSIQIGRYTKIGDLVHAWFDIAITTIGTGSASNVSGLPFTSASSEGQGLPVSIGYHASIATPVASLYGRIDDNQTIIQFSGITAAATTSTSTTSIFADSARVTGCAIYRV